jgi:NAD(P)-dependent dehydrogenase (short-subunit alcohol dehydrogenase family)
MELDGRLAVVTGGGTGMGRELVVQLAAAGCSVAACDVNPDTLAVTAELAAKTAAHGVRLTTHQCDVSVEADVERFRDEVLARHETDRVNLLFNNAGIAGNASFVAGRRADWERTFGVCWGGVYNCSRAFVPLLIASDAGYLVNTSSVNGFWATLGPGMPNTSYSTAKFAVKGFTESLIEDFRIHAPHVKVAVVMPGHIGTDIVINSRRYADNDASAVRDAMAERGLSSEGLSDEDLTKLVEDLGTQFRDNAPMTAAEAATVILDGVRADKWRILVGDDAVALDAIVRADPDNAYSPDMPGFETIKID